MTKSNTKLLIPKHSPLNNPGKNFKLQSLSKRATIGTISVSDKFFDLLISKESFSESFIVCVF